VETAPALLMRLSGADLVLGENDVSIENQNNRSHGIFINVFVPHLKRIEIAGVNSFETFMQAVASTDLPASPHSQSTERHSA
jgi:hypothetical protein